MQRKTDLALRSNYGNKRNTSDIKYIVMHFTANDGDTDEANGNYFDDTYRGASAHYFVDDDSITQSVPDDYVAYSVGGKKYANTKGGSLYGIVTNANTLNIEMCDTVKDGRCNVSEKTLANAIALVKEKQQQYNISNENVIRHYDVTGKQCPAYYVDEAAWASFKARLVTEGWKQDSNGWWYQNADGSYPVSAWKSIGGKWYYFNEKGYMVTGWKEINGKWYYMDESGAMKTGWLELNGQWFYLNESGAMATGLQTIGGATYYFAADGHMCRTNDRGALV
jgi:glucan-binding YG repeat protein